MPPRLTELGVATNELMVGAEQLLAVTVAWAVVVAPHPLVTVIVYVVVDCGCVMSTNPLAVEKDPTPGLMLTVTPVLEVSLMVQASRTIWFPPANTEEGLAVNEVICGAGQGVTVMVTNRSALQVPFALAAVRR